MSKYKQINTQSKYEFVKKNGTFSILYPELTGFWIKDYDKIQESLLVPNIDENCDNIERIEVYNQNRSVYTGSNCHGVKIERNKNTLKVFVS